MRQETIAVHAAAERDSSTGALSPPIYLSTTYEHGPAGEETFGYGYIRENNPTQARLEEAMRQLEGGEAALAFSSGMGASAAVLQTLSPGSHVVFPRDVYIDLRNLAETYLPKWRIEMSFVDMSEIGEVRAAIRPNTELIWVETPSNPLLKITDIACIAAIAHGTGVRLLVDSTFATPILQQPLQLGADLVLHATTKYCGGHTDVQGGLLVMKGRDFYGRVFEARKLLGAVASPFSSWLVLRGLRSLPCRMERHCTNALAIAAGLSENSQVEAVYYPGLSTHRGHEIAVRQMKAFGGMVSFLVKGGHAEAIRVASRVKLFTNATSLGGAESLMEHRASVEGPRTTTPGNLLRLSVGLEHANDLLDDLAQALEQA